MSSLLITNIKFLVNTREQNQLLAWPGIDEVALY